MTSTAMNNLWTYIQGLPLSARNQAWLGEQLLEASRRMQEQEQADEKSSPYTMEEINLRLDEAEREFAQGGGISHEDVIREARARLTQNKVVCA